MIYFKEDYATIYLDESCNMIQLELQGFIQSHNYRETMELAIHLVEEKGITRWLGNLKNMGRMQLQDAMWREEVWFPRFIQSTIQKAAIVMSQDYFNKLTFNETIRIKDKNSKIERRVFYDKHTAINWLLNDINNLTNPDCLKSAPSQK